MDRRRFVKVATVSATGGLVAAGGGAVWLAGTPAPVRGLPSFDHARTWLDRVEASPQARSLTAWPLPQVLEHAAQSIEYSLSGYPQAKPAWFQASAGALAYVVFARRGAMAHSTVEPIPGAPALASTSVADAAARLRAAMDAFEAHGGVLAPHFAYGALDRAQYVRAHLLHLSEHAAEVDLGAMPA